MLNKNQRELLYCLKHIYAIRHSHVFDLIYALIEKDEQMFEEEVIFIFHTLPEIEALQVLQKFVDWVLKGESQ